METLLRKQTLFSMAGDDIVKRAGAMVRMAEFAPGDHVCFQGDPRSPLMLVIAGQLRTSTLSEDGREIPVRTVNAGQSVGEEPILLNSSIHGNIVAVRKSTVALFSRAHAWQLFDEPNVARALNSSMACRVMHLVERHALQGLSRADARISAVIESAISNSEKDELPLDRTPERGHDRGNGKSQPRNSVARAEISNGPRRNCEGRPTDSYSRSRYAAYLGRWLIFACALLYL